MATLTGTNRGDTITGTDAADLIDGRGNNDLLLGRGGNDRILGGTGNDNLEGSLGRDELRGGAGGDNLDDFQGRNRLFGEAGDDFLLGSGLVDGGSGDDAIVAAFRESTLIGGSGADRFTIGRLFSGDSDGTLPSSFDLIADFDQREGDRLDVRPATIFTGLDEVSFVGRGPLTGDAQARYEVRGGDTFVFVNNEDLGEPVGTPDFVFRLDGTFRLTDDDFILIPS